MTSKVDAVLPVPVASMTKVSSPAPPVSVSAPALPFRVSLPVPPSKTSPAEPPLSTSLKSLPVTRTARVLSCVLMVTPTDNCALASMLANCDVVISKALLPANCRFSMLLTPCNAAWVKLPPPIRRKLSPPAPEAPPSTVACARSAAAKTKTSLPSPPCNRSCPPPPLMTSSPMEPTMTLADLEPTSAMEVSPSGFRSVALICVALNKSLTETRPASVATMEAERSTSKVLDSALPFKFSA